jgi:hypothetical protein
MKKSASKGGDIILILGLLLVAGGIVIGVVFFLDRVIVIGESIFPPRDRPARHAIVVNQVEQLTRLGTVRLVDYYQKNVNVSSVVGGSIFTLVEFKPIFERNWTRVGVLLSGNKHRSNAKQVILFDNGAVGVMTRDWYSVLPNEKQAWQKWLYPSDAIYAESSSFSPNGEGTITLFLSPLNGEPSRQVYSTMDAGLTWQKD